jgi:hypothetical protein
MDEEKQGELQNKTRHLANLNREIALANKQLPEIGYRVDLLAREKSLLIEQMRLAELHFTILKPTWEFETDPEYVAVLKAINLLNHEKRMIEFNMLADRLTEQVTAVNAQLDSLIKEKDRVDTWMKENVTEEVDENGTK